MIKKTHAILIAASFALGAVLALLTGGAQALACLGGLLNKIGWALRSLSLSGGAGDALAWALLILLGLTPLLGLLPVKRARTGADWLWPAAAAYALFMLYMLVNPHLLRNVVYPDWTAPEPELLAVTLFAPLAALILAALVLRLSRADERSALLFGRLRLLLTLTQLGAAFAAGTRLPGLFHLTGADLACGIIDALGAFAELGLFVMVCGAATALLSGLERGWLRDENARLADEMALWARRMLAGGLIVMLTRCFLTLALGAHLTNMNITVNLSLGDLIISLCALLLARFVREGVRVRAENDQFI